MIWLSFMIHMCKTIISAGIFFIFSKFWFCRSLVGWKGKKMTQNDKKLSLSHSISQEPYFLWLIIYNAHLHNDIFRRFFHFFKILILQIVSGVKGQRMTQTDKKFCPSPSVAQEPDIMRLTFIAHMCKIIISPSICFQFFRIVIFFWSPEVLKGKKWSKMT